MQVAQYLNDTDPASSRCAQLPSQCLSDVAISLGSSKRFIRSTSIIPPCPGLSSLPTSIRLLYPGISPLSAFLSLLERLRDQGAAMYLDMPGTSRCRAGVVAAVMGLTWVEREVDWPIDSIENVNARKKKVRDVPLIVQIQ